MTNFYQTYLQGKILEDFRRFERKNLSERSRARYEFCDPILEREIEEHHASVSDLIKPILTQELPICELQKIRKKLQEEIQLAQECLNFPLMRREC